MGTAHEEGWIGIDFDGTLVRDDGIWHGPGGYGLPVPVMVERVKAWLRAGYEVRIFTARMAVDDPEPVRQYLADWCEKHLGQRLNATCRKDAQMLELWDDRAVQVVTNTGQRVGKQTTRGLVVRPK